MKMTTLY